MSDDLDDDENLGLEEAGFDNLEEKETTLGDLWRENALVKVGVIAVAAIAIFGAISILGGETEESGQSFVPGAKTFKAPPGTEEATPAYVAAVEEENEARIEEAIQKGGSALPTPIDPPVGRLQIPEEEEVQTDPLQRWHQLQEKRIQMELQNADTLDLGEVPDDTARLEAIESLAQTMNEQMQIILDSGADVQIQTMNVTNTDFREELEQKAKEAAGGGEGEEGGGFFEDNELENFGEQLLSAGEIAYAQLLTEANSDAPAPVLAQIVSGPLRGGRLIGSFQVEDDLLLVTFDTLILDGESIGVSAMVLDPETTLPGMATDVDHRYLQRILLPAAAAFIEGFSEAVANTGQTTVTINNETVATEEADADTDEEIATGFEEATAEIREIIDEMNEDVEPLVRIEAGTPMGILFLEAVVEGKEPGEGGGGEEEE